MSKAKNDGFNANFKTLKEIAEDLRRQAEQEEPDIDGLLAKVEQASKAYKACLERLDNIQKALEAHLPEENNDK